MNSLWKSLTSVVTKAAFLPTVFNNNIPSHLSFVSPVISRACSKLYKMHLRYIKSMEQPKPKKRHVLDGKPFAKGVILKTIIKKPKKPNSANRKCVILKLTTGKVKTAYVPGVGHNLQEHQTVLVAPYKLKDVPGVKLRCVRGKYDLPHPKKE